MNVERIIKSGLAALAIVASFVSSTAWATDSTSVTRAGALPTSNCPNVNDAWYAAGQVPSGYYKSASNGNCYPIPSCPGGTAWSRVTQTCQSICAAGTAWNGSSCVSICTGGQVWNGSSCSCPSGQVWNGSTCGTAPTISASAPSSTSIGTPATISWSATSGSSVAISCSGAGSYSGSQGSSGSQEVTPSSPGTMTCTLMSSNSFGSRSTTTSTTAGCVAGTTWIGSSCVSACSGGTVWNGSSCVCPSGTVWNGSACGVPPAFGTFGVSPVSQTVGGNYTVNWTTGGSGPITISMSCSGANAVSYVLSPSSGGSGAFGAARPGSTNCTATASSAWGSTVASSSALTATCPTGTVWNGSSCAVAATPQGGLNGKVVTVNTYGGLGSVIRLLVLTGSATGIQVNWYAGNAVTTNGCTLTAAGQQCVNGSWEGGTAFAWHPVFRSGAWGPEPLGSGFGRLAGVQLNPDGSLTVVTYGSGGSAAFMNSNPNAYQDSSIGTLSKALIDTYGASATFQITDWVRSRR